VQKSGGDAAVVRVHGTKKALAISTDCTPRYCYADPYEGGKQAVAETYRNICAVGARPLAITNCLNFANPQRPEIMAQIVGCLDGMGDACRALDYPDRVGQRLALQRKQGDRRRLAILPTPAIGGVGLMATIPQDGNDRLQGRGRNRSPSLVPIRATSASRCGCAKSTGSEAGPPPLCRPGRRER
jgi:phosphoribosylformylglycinamidine (FGAM) synthase-like enzyme